jgi:hypothetical protein
MHTMLWSPRYQVSSVTEFFTVEITIILIQTNSTLNAYNAVVSVSSVTEFFVVKITIILIQTNSTLNAYNAMITRVSGRFCNRIFYGRDHDNSNSN